MICHKRIRSQIRSGYDDVSEFSEGRASGDEDNVTHHHLLHLQRVHTQANSIAFGAYPPPHKNLLVQRPNGVLSFFNKKSSQNISANFPVVNSFSKRPPHEQC